MVDRDVAETDRLKKDLEEAQLQIKMKSMPAEAKLDLPEVSLNSDKVAEQSADLSVSSEARGRSWLQAYHAIWWLIIVEGDLFTSASIISRDLYFV